MSSNPVVILVATNMQPDRRSIRLDLFKGMRAGVHGLHRATGRENDDSTAQGYGYGCSKAPGMGHK